MPTFAFSVWEATPSAHAHCACRRFTNHAAGNFLNTFVRLVAVFPSLARQFVYRSLLLGEMQLSAGKSGFACLVNIM